MTKSDKRLIELLRSPVPDGFHGDSPDDLRCSAAKRIEELLSALGTEKTMHAAWRKRAEEAEAARLEAASKIRSLWTNPPAAILDALEVSEQ